MTRTSASGSNQMMFPVLAFHRERRTVLDESGNGAGSPDDRGLKRAGPVDHERWRLDQRQPSVRVVLEHGSIDRGEGVGRAHHVDQAHLHEAELVSREWVRGNHAFAEALELYLLTKPRPPARQSGAHSSSRSISRTLTPSSV